MKLTCKFKPGIEPIYQYIDKDEKTGEEIKIGINKRTFLNEIKIHPEPSLEISIQEEGVVMFSYEF